jgi:hypothetical protein
MTLVAIDWGDVPTWVSAITTLGALIAAGIVVHIEMRRDKQSRALREQEEQAGAVAAWPGEVGNLKSEDHLVIRNGSQLPVYRVVVSVAHRHGTFHISFPEELDDDDPGSVDVVLSFTDAAGRGWRRRADGRLRRLAANEQLYFARGTISRDVATEFDDEPPLSVPER